MPKTMLVVILAVILISLGGTFKTSSAAPLLPPQNLKVPALAFDEKSITLTWEKAADYASIIDYNIYLNGKRIGTANENAGSPAKPYIDQFYADSSNSRAQKISLHNYTVTGLKPSTAYTFTVRAVYRDGRESPDSNRVIQSTTASPRIFNIVDYGAVGDGTTLNTKAIQAAINACTAGGKVLVPAGTFKTGAIWLKSNMTLEIAKDATLLGSENPDDYPYHYLLYSYSTDERFYSLINAQAPDHGSLANIRIIGAGTIDGNGWRQIGVDPQQPELPVYAAAKNSTNKDGSLNPNHVLNIGILAKAQVMKLMDTGLTFKSAYPRRSNLITLRGVNNVYYGGFTAVNPANHTVVNIHCNNVTVAGVMFKTFQCNNGDGIEFIHGNGLTVFNNVFDTGDDCMNFAAGLGAASQKETASQNAWIFNNYFRHGHGAIVAGSHTAAWIEQILGEDNVIEHTDIGLRAKTAPPVGGGARHIVFRDNALKDIKKQAFLFTSGYSDPNAVVQYVPAPLPPQFRDIFIKNCTVDTTGAAAIEVNGTANGPHENLHFENIVFHNAKPIKLNYLKNSSFNNITFDDYTVNPWIITNSSGLIFNNNNPEPRT